MTDAGEEPLVAVARAGKPRGIRGELVANLLTDYPERFADRERLIALHPDGRRETLTVESHWFQGNRVVLKFAGYDTPEQAKLLSGCELAVPEAECGRLEDPDEFYDWQLVGCRVESLEGETLGTVRELLRTGGVELLVVTPEGERQADYLIPFARAICTEVDLEQKVIRVDPPEGLLDF